MLLKRSIISIFAYMQKYIVEKLFDEQDFVKMKYNPHPVKNNVDLMDEFKVLRSIQSFVECTSAEKNKIIRYIMYMYDPGSPLIKSYTNPLERKEAAINLSYFDLKKDEEIITQLTDLSNKEYARMINDYLIKIPIDNGRLWSMIVTSEQTFYEFQKALLSEVVSDTDKDHLSAIAIKSKLVTESEIIHGKLKVYYKELFGDGDDGNKIKGSKTTPESMINS